MSGKRRKYTPEFREQAARLVIETGRPVAHVAAESGVGTSVGPLGAPPTGRGCSWRYWRGVGCR
jgi:hypothetical protein